VPKENEGWEEVIQFPDELPPQVFGTATLDLNQEVNKKKSSSQPFENNAFLLRSNTKNSLSGVLGYKRHSHTSM